MTDSRSKAALDTLLWLRMSLKFVSAGIAGWLAILALRAQDVIKIDQSTLARASPGSILQADGFIRGTQFISLNSAGYVPQYLVLIMFMLLKWHHPTTNTRATGLMARIQALRPAVLTRAGAQFFFFALINAIVSTRVIGFNGYTIVTRESDPAALAASLGISQRLAGNPSLMRLLTLSWLLTVTSASDFFIDILSYRMFIAAESAAQSDRLSLESSVDVKIV